MTERTLPSKSAEAYRTIGEAAEELKLPQHVLRFWETRFPQVKPLKRAGGRRFYRPEDVALLRAIKSLLYGQGYTIKGVQRLLQEQGPRSVAAAAAPVTASAAMPAAPAAAIEGDDIAMRDDDSGLFRAPSLPTRTSAAPPRPADSAAAPPLADHASDIVARLQAVAFDLGECTRLLSAVRSTEN